MGSLMENEGASQELGKNKELPSTDLTLGLGPYFEAWPLQNPAGDQKLGGDDAMEIDLNMNLENPNPDDDDDDDDNDEADDNPNSDEGQAINLDLGRNFFPEMDPKKLKRIMSNRLSAKRSRNRKNQYIADMEKQVKTLETTITLLHPQIAVFLKKRHLLLIEQHQVKLRMATLEKDRIFKEGEMEKVRAEVNRLKGVNWNKEQFQVQETMMPLRSTWGSDIRLMCNSNPNLPPLPPMPDPNVPAAEAVKIGEEASEMQAANASQRYKEKGKAIAYEF